MYRGSRLRNYGQRPIWISVGPIGSSALELKGLPLHNANQSQGFKVSWSFKGTRYFINNNTLAPYGP
jgi:hypothetical protein